MVRGRHPARRRGDCYFTDTKSPHPALTPSRAKPVKGLLALRCAEGSARLRVSQSKVSYFTVPPLAVPVAGWGVRAVEDRNSG